MKRLTLMMLMKMLVAMTVAAHAQSADEILQKMDEVLYSYQDMSGKNTIILIDKNGNEKVREARMQQKGSDRRMFRFTAPASQAGIAVLSLPNDVMYLYLPSFGKERRISSSIKNQKFAGTDFSYEDLEAKPFSEKYTAKLLADEDDVYTLELTPVSPKSAYARVIIWVDKENYYPHKADYYDRGNNKVKTAVYQFEKIGKYWNAREILMTDLRRHHKTKMVMAEVKYDQGFTNDDFTVRKLKQ